MAKARVILIWGGLAVAVFAPLIAAAHSPLLAWRQPVYIMAGFAGIAGLALLLIQPMLAAGLLPGLNPAISRRLHRLCGAALVLAVIIHVVGLWITSPPDVIDALTFTSPTPFSAWGVVAMWAVFAAATLAMLRRRMRLRVITWRRAHVTLAVVTGLCTVAHALLIEGTMETVSKLAICALLLGVMAKAVHDLRIWHRAKKRGRTWRPQ